MQNEFEKQVRDKMEELRFVPTQPVWGKIAAQIGKKKERSRLIWIPIIIALIGGPALLLWTNRDHQNTNAHQTAGSSATPVESNPANTTTSKLSANNSGNPGASNESITPEDPQQSEAVKNHVRSMNAEENNKSQAGRNANGNESIFPTVSASAKQSTWINKAAIHRQNTNARNQIGPAFRVRSHAADQSTARSVTNGNAQPQTDMQASDRRYAALEGSNDTRQFVALLAERLSSPDIITMDVARYNLMEPVGRQTFTMPPLPTRPGRISKWSYGLSLSAGISGISSGLGKGPVQKSVPAAASNFRPPMLPYTYASEVQNSFAYGIAAVVQRRLSPRINMSTGIGYLRAGSKTQVGTKSSSLFSTTPSQYVVNSSTTIADYYNEYHFISVPVEVSYQLLRKVPFYIHGGGSAQRMISTNAVAFNPNTQGYDKADSSFNHTQWHTSFGFDYGFNKAKRTILIGPTVTYGLTSMETSTPPQHLFTFGLRTRLLFKK